MWAGEIQVYLKTSFTLRTTRQSHQRREISHQTECVTTTGSKGDLQMSSFPVPSSRLSIHLSNVKALRLAKSHRRNN